MKKHQINQKKKAFTLVELIIVITILAILATIAFISFQNFTSNARDGNRVATVTQIEKGLNLIQLKTGKYPQPDGDILTGALLLSGSELVYSSMGIIDENISRMINISKTPLDPVSNSNYVYAVNNKQDTYQIATLLESLEANRKLPLIEQTYANENYKAKVIGNHQVNVKVPKDDKIWLTTVPSMIFHPEGSNILNSSGTYHIINGGQNIPYKINDKTITTKETGDKIIQHIRKSQDAKIITVDITDIVKASNETTRKAKIEEIFGTGNTQESKELLASIGAITGSEETINTTILTQTVESIITGGSVGSASSYTAPKTPAICGTANKTYENTANSFGTDTFCDVGTLDGENPTFPSQGNSVNWTCISPDGGVNASCSATKLNPNEEIKECSGKPANSKYYDGSDTHSVTVSFGSSAPTPNYAETPSENSCDFSCNEGYGYNNGNCEGNSYTVTFDSQGGNAITSKNVIYGNTYGTLTSPTRTGYSFTGWFTATSGGTQVTESTNVTSTSNHTLYAQWTATQYTVTLNTDGGSGGSTSVTATYGSAMPAMGTAPTKSGCTFNGYFTSTNGAGTQYYTSGGASARSYDIASSTTLYASWMCGGCNNSFSTHSIDIGDGFFICRVDQYPNIGGVGRNVKNVCSSSHRLSQPGNRPLIYNKLNSLGYSYFYNIVENQMTGNARTLWYGGTNRSYYTSSMNGDNYLDFMITGSYSINSNSAGGSGGIGGTSGCSSGFCESSNNQNRWTMSLVGLNGTYGNTTNWDCSINNKNGCGIIVQTLYVLCVPESVFGSSGF